MSRSWLIWAVVSFGLALAGCSSGGGKKSSRPAPLPPGVDPSELFNLRPDTAPLADARPYYEKDLPSAPAAVPAVGPTDKNLQLRRQLGVPSEFRTPQERNSLRDLRQDRERKERLKEIENRKERTTTDSFGHLLSLIGEPLASAVIPEAVLRRLTDAGGIASTTGAKVRLRLDPAEVSANKAAGDRAEAERKQLLAAQSVPDHGTKYDILILAGGGSRSLYTYGAVCGWADSGTMPEFQVITGVSGGAMAAACVFAGHEYLTDLRRIFLTTEQKYLHGGFWDRKRFPHPFGIGTDSVVDTTKIREHARTVFGRPGYFEKVAAEHAKGRRLYVGTTNLDTQRFVVWDMGAIASEGTAESRKLYEDILLASSAMAPLMQPSHITVTIDGKRYEEIHVDGGFSRNLFFYHPSDWPGVQENDKTGNRMLAGGRVHVILGGKVYESPEGTEKKLPSVGFRGIGTLLTALQRAELARIYSLCERYRMTMRLAAIPDDYNPLPRPAVFDLSDSRRLFCLGYNGVSNGQAWTDSPPERAVSEDNPRRSAVLTTTPSREIEPLEPGRLGVGQARVTGR